MTLENRIRKAAAAKVQVKITTRTRSKHGFYVSGPGLTATHAQTKKGALQMLLAKARCAEPQHYEIIPVPNTGGFKQP
ncbi:MAG: hypothetical protein JWR19_2185 [Pedosphaera sp.]|nr:hypothetical protein [Pedosphaera sp.]